MGSIKQNLGVSLAKGPTKGYRSSWAVDQAMDGREKMGGREKGVLAVGTVLRRWATMAGDEELVGVLDSGATGHGLMN